MTKNVVQEQAGPAPRPSMLMRLTDPDATQDVENQGGGAATTTAVAVVKQLEDDPDEDPGIDHVETQMSVLTFLKIVTAVAAVYMGASPWFMIYDSDRREMCPRTVVCSTTPAELALLTVARFLAGVLFASLTISIFSKCYATRSYLHHSWLGAYLGFEPTHDLHTYFGYLTLISGLAHSLLHVVRHILARKSHLMYETDTGRSGLVACLLLLPIVLPMKFEFFRTKMTFEARKGMHMLFLAMLVALCFHSVVFRYVGSILVVWYILDRLYFTTRQTFLITNPVFDAVGRGTMVSLDLPEGYTFKAGSYIYVNSPMIAGREWHPFSIIQVPGTIPRAAFYAEAVGDWTKELFRLGLNNPRLPLWITAAQPSLMEASIYFDNLVLVCTGAGITPAVSIIERFAERKNIHLMWMSRDGGIIALFEKQLKKVVSTVHLTGKPVDSTKKALQRLFAPSASHSAPEFRQAAWSIIRNPAIAGKAFSTKAPARMASMNEDDGEEETKTPKPPASREVEVKAGYVPTPPRKAARAGGAASLDTSQLRRLSPTSFSKKLDNPVVLEFGRPDIGKYLADTFDKYTEEFHYSRTGDDGHDGGDRGGSFGASSGGPGPSATSNGRGGRRPAAKREMSVRLDASQKVSKQILLTADRTIVEDCTVPGGAKQQRNKNAKVGGPTGTDDSVASGNSLPWLVLYCGANPKVEEAIAKTCDELHVHWQKEYFGAW